MEKDDHVMDWFPFSFPTHAMTLYCLWAATSITCRVQCTTFTKKSSSHFHRSYDLLLLLLLLLLLTSYIFFRGAGKWCSTTIYENTINHQKRSDIFVWIYAIRIWCSPWNVQHWMQRAGVWDARSCVNFTNLKFRIDSPCYSLRSSSSRFDSIQLYLSVLKSISQIYIRSMLMQWHTPWTRCSYEKFSEIKWARKR